VEAARAENWKVNLIEAFDQPWKRLLEGTVGGYWGLFDDSGRELKFRWGEPVSNHPKWRIEAALGIGAALLIFATAWLSRRKEDAGQDGWGGQRTVAHTALARPAHLADPDLLPGKNLRDLIPYLAHMREGLCRRDRLVLPIGQDVDGDKIDGGGELGRLEPELPNVGIGDG